MSARWWQVTFIVGAFGIGVAAPAAQEPGQGANLGKQEYQANCVPCHGASGRGEGPLGDSLSRIPPDLTTYARRNGGTLPTQHARATIDGRGFNDKYRPMPAWAQYYSSEAVAVPDSAVPDGYVDGRLSALVEYLATLQVK